jgi:site-specific recombinase XerD
VASIYTRKRSPYYWVRFRDTETGKWAGASTGVPIKSPLAIRKARAICADYTRKELSSPPRKHSREDFTQWAEAFFQERYTNHHTLVNSMKSLRDVLAYFEHCHITKPRQVTYEVCRNFVPWRTTGKGAVSMNTAWLRFVALRVLMAEAFLRKFCEFNPTREVRSKKTPPKQKLEITKEHEALIEANLEKRLPWMRDCWKLLMRQGCRIAETIVPMERVNTDAMTITFKIKGGRLHTAALHPDLLPVVSAARAEGRPTLFVAPPNIGAIWNMLFRTLKLPYSIHCTRVTVITRLIRAAHPVSQVSNFVGHSEEVDKIYQKLKPSDSLGLLQTLSSSTAQGSGKE